MAKGFMDIEEVSKYLGWPEEMVEGLASELKRVKIDGEWFFSRSLVDKWIEKFVEESNGQAFTKKLEYLRVVTGIPRPKYEGTKEEKLGTYSFATGKLEKE